MIADLQYHFGFKTKGHLTNRFCFYAFMLIIRKGISVHCTSYIIDTDSKGTFLFNRFSINEVLVNAK